MGQNKAEIRQEIIIGLAYGISEQYVGKYTLAASCLDVEKLADAILSRLSELQPINPVCNMCGYPLTLQGNGIAERICTCNKLQPVNKTDEELNLYTLMGQLDNAKNLNVRNDLFDWLLSKRSVLENANELIQDIEGRIRYLWTNGVFGFTEVAREIASILTSQSDAVRDEIDGYRSALGDLRAESEEKAMRFAEWTSIEQWEICTFSDGLFWMPINPTSMKEGRKPTAELFTSPEFLAYYEERKGK